MPQLTAAQELQIKAQMRLASLMEEKLVTRISVLMLGEGKTRMVIRVELGKGRRDRNAAGRQHHVTCSPRWTASPLHPSLSFRYTHPPKYLAKDVVDKIRRFRNLIHPARALKESYHPRTFTPEQLKEFKEMYESVLHSLMYYL